MALGLRKITILIVLACLAASGLVTAPSFASTTFASGTECQVTVSSTSNLTYSHDAGNRTCTFTFQYDPSARSITLPDGLYETTITLQGARGGQGGKRGNTTASTNSYVGQFSGVIPNSSGKTITISTGARGSDGDDPIRDDYAKSGPSGGMNSLGYGNGGSGGGITGGYDAAQQSNGTGGSGGAATVAIIDGVGIFAGGGGGTGGSGRKHGDNGVNSRAGGPAISTATSTVSDNNGGNGAGLSGDNSTIANGTWVGGGGGGGGGYSGGSGGLLGTLRTAYPNPNSTASTGGYPGLNGSDFPLESTASSYALKATSVTTADADGSVVLVVIYKASTVTSISFSETTLQYRTLTPITAVTTVSGRVTFRANGKFIPGCRRLTSNSSNSYSVTCMYRAANHAQVLIKAIFDPGPAFYESTATTSKFQVVRRTNPR
jgi:hypothetical protein